MRHSHPITLLACVGILLARLAQAGPPYVSDDPEPTDRGHYEIYLYDQGSGGRGGVDSEAGIDFNYGAGDDLQLTAVLPYTSQRPASLTAARGVGNIEVAAKYRFLRKDDVGWDVAFFPSVALPSASHDVGDRHAALFLPLWLERDWDSWSTFGGGGCQLDRGAGAKDFCLAGWALTRQVLPHLQLGAELVHQGAQSADSRAWTRVGAGLRYDLDERFHILAYAGPGLQNLAQTGRYAWYTSVLLTF